MASKKNVKAPSDTKVPDDIDKHVTGMTEEDVANENRKLAKVDPDVLNDLYNTQSQIFNSIVTMVKKQLTDEEDLVEVERLQRILNLAPVDEKFIRTKDKIWAVREHIINKNAKFFLDRDYSKQIKKDGNQVFLETLISLIKEQYNALSAKDQNFYWEKASQLLIQVCKYHKLLKTVEAQEESNKKTN